MTDPTSEASKAQSPIGQPKMGWPDDPIDKLNEMRSAQAKLLHDMFSSLTEHSRETFEESPYDAQDYIRLALRAQANCRMTMADIVWTELAARRHRAESEK